MPTEKNVGEPCAGKPLARFDAAAGGNQASRAHAAARPRRLPPTLPVKSQPTVATEQLLLSLPRVGAPGPLGPRYRQDRGAATHVLRAAPAARRHALGSSAWRRGTRSRRTMRDRLCVPRPLSARANPVFRTKLLATHRRARRRRALRARAGRPPGVRRVHDARVRAARQDSCAPGHTDRGGRGCVRQQHKNDHDAAAAEAIDATGVDAQHDVDVDVDEDLEAGGEAE